MCLCVSVKQQGGAVVVVVVVGLGSYAIVSRNEYACKHRSLTAAGVANEKDYLIPADKTF